MKLAQGQIEVLITMAHGYADSCAAYAEARMTFPADHPYVAELAGRRDARARFMRHYLESSLVAKDPEQ